MTKIDKEIIKKWIEKEYPNTTNETKAEVDTLIDKYNSLDEMGDRWYRDECQNFTTLGSSQYLGHLSDQKDEIKQRLRNMGIKEI